MLDFKGKTMLVYKDIYNEFKVRTMVGIMVLIARCLVPLLESACFCMG